MDRTASTFTVISWKPKGSGTITQQSVVIENNTKSQKSKSGSVTVLKLKFLEDLQISPYSFWLEITEIFKTDNVG